MLAKTHQAGPPSVRVALAVRDAQLASAGRDAPDYASALDELGRMEIVPADHIARIRGIAGFRNVLVRAYLEVDLARVHELLTTRLEDFETFASHIERHLAQTDA